MDFVREDDVSSLRSPPHQRLLSEGEIGEYTHGVGLDESLGREVASDGVKAVFLAVSWVRELGCVTQFEDHILFL